MAVSEHIHSFMVKNSDEKFVFFPPSVLMYIHRGFFAKALLDHPKDPLQSPYSHSYLSAYRAALSLLKVIREHYVTFPNLVSRFWSLWSHAFSATVSFKPVFLI